MIETGARSPAMKQEEIANVAMAAAAISGVPSLLMKAGLKGEKKSQTQNYVNKLAQNYNKARQESL